MQSNPPKISVGMPVRNGERYVRQALDSLLAQTFTDFELIICDNSSTDDTEAICREYAAKDDRVRYFRNDRNIGPSANHALCFEHARGRYFRWHAHDDLLDPRCLERCVGVLDHDPAIVNCHTRARVIDEQGAQLRDHATRLPTDSPNVTTRFRALVLVPYRQHVNYEVYGLMRRADMAAVPPQGAHPTADRVFVVRMALRNRFHEAPEYLFLPRAHGSQSSQQKTTRAKYLAFLGTGPLPPAEWWDSSKKGKIVFPEWKLLAEYWKSIDKAPISVREALVCRAYLLVWMIRNLPRLGRDVAYAVEHVLTRRDKRRSTPELSPPINASEPS